MEIFKEGSRGELVKQIQKVVGCYPDGIWGPLTTEGVKAWQKAHGLTPDGKVGPATFGKMSADLLRVGAGMKKSKRVITDIVVHCTGSKEGVAMTIADLRRLHRAKGWSDIGYHYVIDLEGHVNPGRDVDVIGAHVSGYNAHSIGVVYVGGLDVNGTPKDTRTEEQKTALLGLLVALRRLYPGAVIKGHRDYSPDLNGNGMVEPCEWVKSCPCFEAISEYRRL